MKIIENYEIFFKKIKILSMYYLAALAFSLVWLLIFNTILFGVVF